ncbi:hypothetical protein VNO80_12755 [Phaseolus coccineus]|uniref:Uncharacterized protein n=1 Tax=Phaseolus coccineus TaxID=3886 RepID=A0AAN9N235_PHACN
MDSMVWCHSLRALFGFRCNLRFAVVVFEIVLILAWLEVYNGKLPEHQFYWGGLEGGARTLPHTFAYRTRYLSSESDQVARCIQLPHRIYLNYDAVGHSPDRDCQKIGDIFKLGEPPMTSFPGLPSCNPLAADPPVFADCWCNCTSEDISGEDKKHRLHKFFIYCLSWWCLLELYYKDWIEILIIGGNLLQALGQTAEWFRRVLSVEPVKGNLRLSGYSAC